MSFVLWETAALLPDALVDEKIPLVPFKPVCSWDTPLGCPSAADSCLLGAPAESSSCWMRSFAAVSCASEAVSADRDDARAIWRLFALMGAAPS